MTRLMSAWATFAFGLLALIFCAHVADSKTVSLDKPKPIDPCWPRIFCKCAFGTTWTTDSNGCRRCSCEPSPPVCPMYKCPQLDCPLGQAMDKNGCPTCGCNNVCPIPICPLIKCANGLDTDANGCKICKCKPNPPCYRARCAPGTSCPNGFAVDSNGCQTCRCKPPICPPLCRRWCPNGFVKDTNGCQTCKCNPPICPMVACAHKRLCFNGYMTDANGCNTCRCKPFPICPRVTCAIYCRNGRVLDSRGCQTCQCKPDIIRPVPRCDSDIMCPAVACPPGQVPARDKNGCRIGCGCRGDPNYALA